jgi:hypothetical protein
MVISFPEPCISMSYMYQAAIYMYQAAIFYKLYRRQHAVTPYSFHNPHPGGAQFSGEFSRPAASNIS